MHALEHGYKSKHDMARSVFSNQISEVGFFANHSMSFPREDYVRIMNRVGLLFLREGLDFRTEHEKAEQLRQNVARIKAGSAERMGKTIEV